MVEEDLLLGLCCDRAKKKLPWIHLPSSENDRWMYRNLRV
jgi:hypothetical protein